ncbi:MAG: NFACT family protein, partial [Bilophila sp.]
MDCHVFRRLCAELAPALMGCRVEKIHQPAPDVTMFTLYGASKSYLFLKAGRKAPFLFLSRHKIAVGSAPPASTMRLRKYLADRRIVDVQVDWAGRQLFLSISPELHLCLDLRAGPSLLFAPLPLLEAPRWPDPAHWAEACADDGWRNWPVLTPPLRRTLPLLPHDEQAALLLDLEAGGGDLFLYERVPADK